MTVMAGILLEPLGPQQRVDEVDHQPRGHEARKRIIEDHGEASSEPIAGDGVADRQREEDECDGEHDDVQHLLAPSGACIPRTASAFGGAVMRCASLPYVFERE